MGNYSIEVSKHRRLTILRFLNESNDGVSNASILEDICNDFGIPSTRDQVVGELTWLSEQGFVTTKEAGDFVVATLTERGEHVAVGKVKSDGVQRPRRGS